MHGDPHMGNIFVYHDENNKLKIEFIDTGNCVVRSSNQIKRDLSFFANYLVGNSEGVAKYFLAKSGINWKENGNLLVKISKDIDEKVFRKGENITQFADVQKELNTILEENGIDIGTDESNALKAQFQFISNVSALNALSGQSLNIGTLFKDIPNALYRMMVNNVNPISSVIDAVKFACLNRKIAIGNALQFKVKKKVSNIEQNTELVVVKVNNKTLKFARGVLRDVKDLIKNRYHMQPEEIESKIAEISKNAKIVKSQVKELFEHLSE